MRTEGAVPAEDRVERFIDGFFADPGHIDWGKWNYADGCLVLAARQLYEATGRREFRDYALRYTDRYVGADGSIATYRPEHHKLDDILPGRGILFALRETGEARYRLALGSLERQLAEQPRTGCGNYWHKDLYPHQVWLDGLFMAQPFRAELDGLRGSRENLADILEQFANVRKYMRDEKTGLYVHGWDESRSVFWADPATGRSKSIWLRAMGWFLMALADTAEATEEAAGPLGVQLREALDALLHWQDPETGLFWQVADRPDLRDRGNYPETSGSAMTAAAIWKGCRLGLLPAERYAPAAEKILAGIARERIVERDGSPVLTGTCAVAGLGPEPGRRDGTADYYFSEPVTDNDNKGAAALAMAWAQERLWNKENSGK